MQTFDAAFQSRIHISLEYHELDAKSRKTVWVNFLEQYNVAQAATRERPLKKLPSAAKAANGAQTSSTSAVDGMDDQELKTFHHNQTHPHQITSSNIDKLSQMSMNGREIKNILKSAQLLASREGKGLSYEHVKTVMEVMQHLHNATRDSERTKGSLYH